MLGGRIRLDQAKSPLRYKEGTKTLWERHVRGGVPQICVVDYKRWLETCGQVFHDTTGFLRPAGAPRRGESLHKLSPRSRDTKLVTFDKTCNARFHVSHNIHVKNHVRDQGSVPGFGLKMITFYDSSGSAVAYIAEDNGRMYLYSGSPVAWFDDEHLWSYSGRWLGWLQDGLIYDRRGRVAFFAEGAIGGPAKPARHARPARSARHAQPARSAREARPARPARSASWSDLSGESFFRQ